MAVAAITEPRSRHVYTHIGEDDVLVRPTRTGDEETLRALQVGTGAVPRFGDPDDRLRFGVVALGATTLGGKEGPLLGAAHYRRDTATSTTAIVDVAVFEHARRRGVGTLLLRELVRDAIEHGVERLRTGEGKQSDTLFRLLRRFGRLKLRPGGILEIGLPSRVDAVLCDLVEVGAERYRVAHRPV